MRNYELMAVFPLEEDKFKELSEAVRSILKENGAQITSEEPYGDRDLAYEIKKHKRGRYLLFNVSAQPDRIAEIDRQIKLAQGLLTWLFIRKDD